MTTPIRSTAARKRIFIVEDHPIFRLGMTELINDEPDLAVCGDADTVPGALSAIERLSPDLVIADISLREGDGIELVKALQHRCPGLPVLMLSMHSEALYAERALAAGARGYIMKQEAMDSVVGAVRLVLAGRIYASETVKDRIMNGLFQPAGDGKTMAVNRLTDRELEVFRLIGRGLSTKEIAHTLNLSVKTIGTYRERIKEKLRIKHATELVQCAVHWTSSGDPAKGTERE
ncbi:response regulator [Desulfococcus sp.]|uniref:response regulator transcription factor n=1 Tax=Desulfococcus sp. TaxID=2025834 RepID=UPI0035935518